MISISIWQCLVEFCTNFLIIGCLFIFKEHTYNLLEFLLLITCCLNYVIFPSFYLLADFRFRNTFYQKGSFQAVWSALKQNYEKNSNDNELEMQVMSWNSSIVKKICCCWSIFLWKYVYSELQLLKTNQSIMISILYNNIMMMLAVNSGKIFMEILEFAWRLISEPSNSADMNTSHWSNLVPKWKYAMLK